DGVVGFQPFGRSDRRRRIAPATPGRLQTYDAVVLFRRAGTVPPPNNRARTGQRLPPASVEWPILAERAEFQPELSSKLDVVVPTFSFLVRVPECPLPGQGRPRARARE